MKNNKINRFLSVCLDIADYYDEHGDADKDWYGDELTKDIGLGYRALTGYLRQGVKDIVELQQKYHRAKEEANYHKIAEEDQREYLMDLFGDDEPYTINEKDKKRIKEFIQGIMAEWEEKEKENED